ncbi:MAE_28990/MAE_18760 family HEPN-like nuclease [Microbulbifer thermotolerans]|uniref:MAE_28990/MAE_18760 family HEPN-like nuclease n=1 Tax=Microbulbifer thermotolerans TaxID=252514 RepID=UPI002672E1A1|nr:MAE_28990/MAE_18760 family HEPN-like nuclease [Microbulbifer thermotolerans]WKT60038.1 MAE_28990/MAE_18760 family HEPN-like nuclease [Microbulbifer thermotolerans]
MSEVSRIVQRIDTERLRRARELSELKVRMTEMEGASKYGVNSKALIVLSYAHWEGFYNECVTYYIEALKEADKKVRDTSWLLLIGVLRPDLQRLRDRNHSSSAEIEFVERLRSLLDSDFNNFDNMSIRSRSNLNFATLKNNFNILGFDISPFQRWRIKIDKELVGWRHSVAHGDEPDLSSVDLHRHVQFTQDMLLLLADTFQNDLFNKSIYSEI